MNPSREILLLTLQIVCLSYTAHCFDVTSKSVSIQTEFNKAIQGSSFTCPFTTVTCDATTPYANFDGTCHNIANSLYGSKETPFKRILPAKFDTGSDKRTLRTNGTTLPNTRDISNLLLDSTDAAFNTEPIWTHIFATFGQFLTHDLAMTASSTSDATVQPSCLCSATSADCLSISVADSALGRNCMEFIRSSRSFNDLQCLNRTLAGKENLNLMNSFIDASNVYGSDESFARSLRTLTGGLLQTSSGISTAYPYLPLDNTATCSSVKCFLAGDARKNENLGLSGIHHVFVREHNRIAAELAKVNAGWSDETLYQQTRRIIIGIMQHIVYDQYVPSVIGSTIAASWGLTPLTSGFYTGYDSSVNPGIYAEFATAAMRFGHTVVHNDYNRYSRSHVLLDSELDFHDINFNADQAYNSSYGGIDAIVRGLITDKCGRYDLNVPSDLRNLLIGAPGGKPFDLAAYNLNRGRDHGIQSYVSYVKLATGKDITSFADLSQLGHFTASINQLTRIYGNVNDIELWIGGNGERNHGGPVDQLTGSTFSYIIAKQFQDLKRGDRFYYENAPDASKGTDKTAFTLDQLNEIRKVSFSSVLCNNLELDSIQADPFFIFNTPLNANTRKLCSAYSQMNFRKWKSS